MLLLISIRIIVLIFVEQNFKQTQVKGESEVVFLPILHPSLYQNVIEGKFTFIDGREVSVEKERLNRCIVNLVCIQL